MQMGTTHRQFRHNLYVTYIVPNKHNRRELQKPPLNYQYIKDHHWKEFVDKKLSHNFEVLIQVMPLLSLYLCYSLYVMSMFYNHFNVQEQRRKAQDARKQNQYNHSLGSGGYKRVVKKIVSDNLFQN